MEVGGKHHDPATLPGEWIQVSTEYEAGWAPELVWMLWCWENLLALEGFEPHTTQPIDSCHTD